VIKAELPGMDKENIEMNVTDHSLTKTEEPRPKRSK
jgi:HSP20 family molecular chaperone IbpA